MGNSGDCRDAPDRGRIVTVIAHRYYRLDGEGQEVALSGASSRGQVWSKDEMYFWLQTLRGHVLIGHNIGIDFDALGETFRGFDVTLDDVGLLDTLELALLVFPLARNREGRVQHALHALAETLNLDPNDSLKRWGKAHEARYDAALCWRLIHQARQTLRKWTPNRREGVRKLKRRRYIGVVFCCTDWEIRLCDLTVCHWRRFSEPFPTLLPQKTPCHHSWNRGYERHTTNNRMELRAALEALRRVPPNVPVRIVTDSQYLIKGMTEWLPDWKRRRWRTTKGKPVKNQSLWQKLEPLAGDRVTWEHVRGHTGHAENERANTLAQAYALGKQPPRQPPDPIAHQPRETPPRVVPKSPNNQPLNLDGISRPSGKTYLSLVNGQLARHTTWEECSARINGVSGAKFKKCKSLDEEIAVISGWELSPDALRELTTTTTTNQPSGSSLPHVLLLCREFLPIVSRLLAKAGFTRQNKTHSHSAFRMEHQKAIVEAYSQGKIQRQGQWTAADEQVWQALPQAEDKWLSTQLAALNISTTPQIAWNKEICGYLWTLLATDRLPSWRAEQIGRYRHQRHIEGGSSKGILAPSKWRTPPEADGEAALWQALTTAHRRPDRWCAARVQGQNGQLSIAVLPLTPTAQFMAKARDWGNGHKVAEEEQKRLLSQIKSRLLFFCERWTKETWYEQAQARGNQLDFLYDWLGQTISANASKLNIPLTRPLDLIMKPTGNEEWAHRLLSQRTNGRIHFCVPKLPEEIDAYQLAHFLARSACAKETKNSE